MFSVATTTTVTTTRRGKVHSYTLPEFSLWKFDAESATEKVKKKAEKPQKNGKEFERPLESIGLKNWLSKESKSFKNRENIK